jgi:hypothetical protein
VTTRRYSEFRKLFNDNVQPRCGGIVVLLVKKAREFAAMLL